VFVFNDCFPVKDHLVTFDGDHFAGVLVNEILNPGTEHPGCQLAANQFLDVYLGDLMFLCEVEDLENILVTLKANGPEECGDRQFFLPVDVGVHHVVDVSGELYP